MSIFTKREKPIAEPPAPSAAESLGLRPPRPTKEHLAGIEAAARINLNQSNTRLAQYEAARESRRQAEDARDNFLWQKVLERQRHAVG